MDSLLLLPSVSVSASTSASTSVFFPVCIGTAEQTQGPPSSTATIIKQSAPVDVLCNLKPWSHCCWQSNGVQQNLSWNSTFTRDHFLLRPPSYKVIILNSDYWYFDVSKPLSFFKTTFGLQSERHFMTGSTALTFPVVAPFQCTNHAHHTYRAHLQLPLPILMGKFHVDKKKEQVILTEEQQKCHSSLNMGQTLYKNFFFNTTSSF